MLLVPINIYNNNRILIVVDKSAKQVMVFDSLAISNQYHAGKVFNSVKKMDDGTTKWIIVTNEESCHIQGQLDKANGRYFTCWYAWQLVTNESVDWFGGDYEVVRNNIRGDIMCSIIERKIAIKNDKQKKDCNYI